MDNDEKTGDVEFIGVVDIFEVKVTPDSVECNTVKAVCVEVYRNGRPAPCTSCRCDDIPSMVLIHDIHVFEGRAWLVVDAFEKDDPASFRLMVGCDDVTLAVEVAVVRGEEVV